MLDAIQRFIKPEPLGNAILVLSVGGGGLLINAFGMILFCGNAHVGHSHGDKHSHKKGHKHEHNDASKEEHSGKNNHGTPKEHVHSGECKHEKLKEEKHTHDHSGHKTEKKKEHSHGDENMCGVFLHILGDFLGSVAVVISATVTLVCRIYLPGSDQYTQYVDPALSVLIAIILFFPTIPLIYRCYRVLLQSVPQTVDMKKLKEKILAIEGVSGIHELHVWSLSNQKIFGDVHVLAKENLTLEMCHGIYRKLKNIFHEQGIHSTTIQLEYAPGSKYECNLLCSENCYEDWCCEPSLKQKE